MPVISRASLAFGFACLLGLSPAASAQTASKLMTPEETRDTNLRAYTELLRADLRADKVAVITEVMQFTEDEDKKFWPVYREHEAALSRLNDERMKFIEDYAAAYTALTDEAADRLAKAALDLEGKRHDEMVAYYNKLKAALTPRTAARALQVEHQLLLILDLQIAASLPIAQ